MRGPHVVLGAGYVYDVRETTSSPSELEEVLRRRIAAPEAALTSTTSQLSSTASRLATTSETLAKTTAALATVTAERDKLRRATRSSRRSSS